MDVNARPDAAEPHRMSLRNDGAFWIVTAALARTVEKVYRDPAQSDTMSALLTLGNARG